MKGAVLSFVGGVQGVQGVQGVRVSCRVFGCQGSVKSWIFQQFGSIGGSFVRGLNDG